MTRWPIRPGRAIVARVTATMRRRGRRHLVAGRARIGRSGAADRQSRIRQRAAPARSVLHSCAPAQLPVPQHDPASEYAAISSRYDADGVTVDLSGAARAARAGTAPRSWATHSRSDASLIHPHVRRILAAGSGGQSRGSTSASAATARCSIPPMNIQSRPFIPPACSSCSTATT